MIPQLSMLLICKNRNPGMLAFWHGKEIPMPGTPIVFQTVRVQIIAEGRVQDRLLQDASVSRVSVYKSLSVGSLYLPSLAKSVASSVLPAKTSSKLSTAFYYGTS